MENRGGHFQLGPPPIPIRSLEQWRSAPSGKRLPGRTLDGDAARCAPGPPAIGRISVGGSSILSLACAARSAGRSPLRAYFLRSADDCRPVPRLLRKGVTHQEKSMSPQGSEPQIWTRVRAAPRHRKSRRRPRFCSVSTTAQFGVFSGQQLRWDLVALSMPNPLKAVTRVRIP